MRLKLTFLFACIAFSHSLLAQVVNNASFPGGPAAWNKYLTQQIQMHVDEFKKKDIGTCIISFTVDRSGNVQDVIATNMKKSKLANVAIEAIKSGPKWSPAQQNGRTVNDYRLQPVTFESSK